MLGAIGGCVAATICVLVSLRAVGRLSPRALLTAQSLDDSRVPDARARAPQPGARRRLSSSPDSGCWVLGFAKPSAQAGAFFGAGAALLVGALLWLAGWLRARDARLHCRPRRLGRGAPRVSAALPSARRAACCLPRSSHRRRSSSSRSTPSGAEGGELTSDPKSGTGGYVLFAESELPLLHNPNEPSGREALTDSGAGARAGPFHALPRPRRGRRRAASISIVQPIRRSSRPKPASSKATASRSRARWPNPTPSAQTRGCSCGGGSTMGRFPSSRTRRRCSTCCTSRVGDTFSIDTGGERPLLLRFVGALGDSVLQGELVDVGRRIRAAVSQQQGYRLFLIDAPSVRVDR